MGNYTFRDNIDPFQSLRLEWLLMNGNAVPASNWVQLDNTAKSLAGFISKSTYQNQPAIGYEYILKATDKDGNSGSKIYNFKLGLPPREPNYKRLLKLTSTNSIVYVRNYVQILFDIQNILFQYAQKTNQGISALRGFITEELKVTKSNDVTTIEMTWSITTFLYNQCQLQTIMNLRSKTIGSYLQEYTSAFQPLYQFNSEEEIFSSVCSYLSADPARVGASLSPFSVVYGAQFSLTIPSTAFLPPLSASTMSLTVQLRSSTGEALTKTSWINLNGNDLSQGVKLEGYASYAVASQQTSFSFRLVALTPLLVETYRIISINVGQFQSMQENYIVTFLSSSVITVQYSTFIRSFISTISAYLSVSSSSIIVYSFENTQANTVLKWTITTFTTGCDINLSSSYTSRMIASNGQPNNELRLLINNIGFPLAQINIKVGATCQKPVINNAIGQISFAWGTFFQYVIAANAYVDARDGTNLQFSMFQTGSAFSSSNWITVNSTTRTIYGVPIIKSIVKGRTYTFTLRVTNSIGNYIDDSFTVTSNIDSPAFSYRYKVRIEYSSYYQSMASVLFGFLNRMYAYFRNSNRNQLLVQEVISFVRERRMEVIYYNTSFRVTPCDTKSIAAANTLLFDGVKPSPLLINAMKPNFNVLDINSISGCPKNVPPAINVAKLPEEAGPHSISWGNYFQATLSDDLFYDEEDGGTKNLLITFKSISSNFNLALSSWIYYDQASFTVYAVPMDATFNLLSGNTLLKYVLRAEDSGGLGVSTEYIMQPTGAVTNFYRITYVMEVYNIAASSYAYQLITMFTDLWSILGAKYQRQMCVRSYQVTSVSGNNGIATLVWTPCNLPGSSCNFDIINEIKNKLFVTGSASLKQEVTKRFTYFTIKSVTDIGSGACGLNPPTISYQIPTIQISFCGLMKYAIPQNAFIDLEDGNTGNLRLTLTDASGNAKPSSSWISFDASKQEITTLLQQSMLNNNFQRVQRLQLTATDRSGLNTTQIVTFNVNGNAVQTDYKVDFQARLSFVDTNVNSFIRFAEKMGNYFGDNGKGFEAIRQRKTTDGTTIFEFGNCTIPYSPCNVVEMNSYKNKLKNPDGSWRQSFQNILLPEFTKVFITDSLSGPCAVDEAPKLVNTWGPLYVEIYKTYIIQVPENTFFDKEEGNTRKLQLELRTISGTVLSSNFWVSFNSVGQTITIVTTKAIAESLPSSRLTLNLYAYDSNRKSASQQLHIVINYSTVAVSHYLSMQFTTVRSSFVTIYNQLRTRITSYFQDNVAIGTVSFHSATNNFLTTLSVVWSNRTISSTNCENEKINYMLSKLFSSNNIVHPAFVLALSTFTISKLTFFYDGICDSERKPPVVVTQISPLTTSFCNYIEYLVPANTFSDVLDGNTRSLSLVMLNLDNTNINLNSFVYFNEQTQTIRVNPYDTAFTSVLFPKRYSYLLKATNKRGLYVTTNVHIDITTSPPNYSYSFQITGTWLKQQNLTPITDIIAEFQLKSSSYFGFQTGSNIHIIDVMRPSPFSTTFSIKATSCLLGYNPCDNNNIKILQQKIFSSTGTFHLAYSQTLLPNIQLLSIAEQRVGPCKKPNEPPTQFLPIPTVTLNSCSDFSYKLAPQTFKDAEDGFTLSYVIIYINGLAINLDTTWIYNTINKDILATVNNDVVLGSGTNGYTVTIRAFDSQQAFVDATWKINIAGKTHQTFYKIILDVTSKTSLRQAFIERYYLTKYINDFLNANYTNAINIELLQNNRIRFAWSSCSLPDYCDRNAANIFFMNMKVGNNFVTEFVNALSPRYVLNDVSMETHATCRGPISPPIPSRTTWTITINQCGGMNMLVPSNMFTDPEDGNTRNLDTKLIKSNNQPLPHWINYDTTSQTVMAFPTRAEAVAYQASPYSLKLTATDKTGLSAFINVPIIIQVPAEPKYLFQFQYTVLNVGKRIPELLAFSQKLSNYLTAQTNQIGLISYSFSPTSTSRTFKYGNCSISYNPCDLASLTQLRNRFINSNNFPNTAFQAAMLPQYNMRFVLTEKSFPCSRMVPTPPRVVKPIPTLFVPMCGYYQYLIPEDTFYDPQDGNTRKLTLSLLSSSGQAILRNSWIQFNSQTQTIYAMITASDALANVNGFRYRLKAVDSSQLPAETTVNIQATGQYGIAQECQIKLDLLTTATSNKVERMRYVAERLKVFFQLTSVGEIAISNYVELSSTKFQLYWTYCSSTYQTSATNVAVDYSSLITKILMKLFLNDRKTIVSSFYTAFGNGYTVESVSTQFSKRCQDLPPIADPSTNQIKITFSSCGYNQRNLAPTLFYDFEDGGTSSLQLSMYLSDGVTPVPLNTWVNVDTLSQSIIAVCNDNVRALVPGSYMFFLKAKDKSAQTASLKVILEKFQQNPNQLSPFEITFEMKYNAPVTRSLTYESMYASERIKSYYQITSNPAVLIKMYDITNGYTNFRRLTWTTCEYQTCSSGVLSQTKALLTDSGVLPSQFVNSFLSDLTIYRVYYTSTCNPPNVTPLNSNPIPPLRPQYCSLFSYQVTRAIFYDNANGDVKNLKVQLYASNGSKLPKASWIQINTAKLQIYAVNIASKSSQVSSSSFVLTATNSGGLSSTTSVKVNFDKTPYTADCPITMSFQYKYVTSDTADVDVIWLFAKTLQKYYGDANVMIKVLDFYQLINGDYQMKWSNCSFVYNTQEEANKGLAEKDRGAIIFIFSKLLDTNTQQINSNFRSAMQEMFTIKTLIVSYQCIETDPYPTNTDDYKIYLKPCELNEHILPNNLFIDHKDGDIRSMQIALTYTNGKIVSQLEWLQVNTDTSGRKYIYGMVSESIMLSAPQNGFRYLIRCTDSSGRSATLPLIAFVIQQAVLSNNLFTIGFRNYITNTNPAAYVLSEISSKIAKYIDPSDTKVQVFVKNFNKDSFIQFVRCNLPCNENTFNVIFNKFQVTKYQTIPNFQLIQALRPQFDVNYAYVSAPTCVTNNNETITPQNCPSIQLLTCGWFTKPLSSQCFRDSTGRNTKSFLTTMLQQDLATIPRSSWIQYDVISQSFYGIPIWNQILATQNYKMKATHPASGNSALSSINFQFDGYSAISKSNNKACQVTLKFEDTMDKAMIDVTIVRKLLEKISAFSTSNIGINSYLVMNFMRSNNIMSLTFSNCTWFQLVNNPGNGNSVYLQEVMKVLGQYFVITGTTIVGIKPSFRYYLAPDFVFRSFSASVGCTSTPSPPPFANKDLLVTLERRCGKFTYTVPTDTFTDPRYGDTRALQLSLLTADNQELPKSTWIKLNNSQIVYGLIEESVVLNQPVGGYKFSLRATNQDGQSATTRLTVVLPSQPWTMEFSSLTISFRIVPPPTYDVDYKLALISQLESYALFQSMQEGFYIQSFVNVGNVINAKVAYCYQCSPLNYVNTMYIQQNTQSLHAWLLNKFSVYELTAEMQSDQFVNNACVNEDDPPVTPYKQNFALCSENIIFLRDLYNPLIDSLTVDLLTIDGKTVPLNSWVYLLSQPYRIVAFPTMDMINLPYYEFFIRIKRNNIVLADLQRLRLTVVNRIPSIGQKYTLSLTGNTNQVQSDVSYIFYTWSLTQSFIGGAKTLQHVSFTRVNNNPVSFVLSWYNCSLPCGDDNVRNVNSKLFQNNAVNVQYSSLFSPTYTVSSLTTMCTDDPPIVNATYNITIPACGVYKHKLPNTFAYDSTDGYLNNLNVELRNIDGSAISRSSWIQFNSIQKEIQAIPNNDIIMTTPASGWRYMLHVSDRNQKTSFSTLFVQLQRRVDNFVKLDVSFRSSYPATTSYVQIQESIMQLVSSYIGDNSISEYHSYSFKRSGTAENFVMQISNCTVNKYMCASEDAQLKLLEGKIKQTDGSLSPNFASYVQATSGGRVVITSASMSYTYSVDLPPQIREPIPTAYVTYCSGKKYKVPDNTFSDEKALTYSMKSQDNSQVLPLSNWVYMYQNSIYMFPQISTRPGTYKYLITAKDSCGQTANTVLTVDLSGQQATSKYSLTMRLQKQNSLPYSYEIWNIQETLKKCYDIVSNTIRSESFLMFNGYMEYKWSDCAIRTDPCDVNKIDKINSKTFSYSSVLSDEIKTCFQPNFVLQNVVENRLSTCQPPLISPTANYVVQLRTRFCQKMNFQVPIDVFSSTKDGNTRNLKLELLMISLDPLPASEWVQFDQENHLIYGYARTGENIESVKTSYTYKLKATDSSGAYSFTNVVITIIGEIPALNYMLSLSATSVASIQKSIDQEISLMAILRNYFNKENINDVSFTRDSTSSRDFTFKWTFCQFPKATCPCNRIREYRQLMLETNTIRSIMQPNYLFKSWTDEKKGNCLKNGNPVAMTPIPNNLIPVGRCYGNVVPQNAFYDAEDGWTRNLTLYLRNMQNQEFARNFWIQMDSKKQKVCGILTNQAFKDLRLGTKKNYPYEYNILARDSCLNEVSKKVVSTIDIETYPADLQYVFYMVLYKRQGDLMSNCSDIDRLLYKIADYSGGYNKTDIMVEYMTVYNNTATNFTEIAWGYRNVSGGNCSNSTVKNLQEKFVRDNNQTNPNFISYMQPEYEVVSVRDEKRDACVIGPAAFAILGSDDNFDWWFLWLLLALALLFLLAWLIWLCCRRYCPTFCPTCCGPCGCCSICTKCCVPSGKYASFSEDGPNDVSGGSYC